MKVITFPKSEPLDFNLEIENLFKTWSPLDAMIQNLMKQKKLSVANESLLKSLLFNKVVTTYTVDFDNKLLLELKIDFMSKGISSPSVSLSLYPIESSQGKVPIVIEGALPYLGKTLYSPKLKATPPIKYDLIDKYIKAISIEDFIKKEYLIKIDTKTMFYPFSYDTDNLKKISLIYRENLFLKPKKEIEKFLLLPPPPPEVSLVPLPSKPPIPVVLPVEKKDEVIPSRKQLLLKMILIIALVAIAAYVGYRLGKRHSNVVKLKNLQAIT